MRTTNRELWVKRVERWRDSGLSAKEFAAEIGVNPGTLAHWKWRLGAERRARVRASSKRISPATAPAFVEVAPATVAEALTARPPTRTAPPPLEQTEVATAHEPLEVVLRDGVVIRVPVNFAAASLQRLVAVLAPR